MLQKMIFLKCIFFLPWYLRRKWTASLHLLFPMSVYVSSLSLKYPFFLSLSLAQTHPLTMAGICPFSYVFLFNSVFSTVFLAVLLISPLICPPSLRTTLSPHHTRLFQWVSLDVYIIEACCVNACVESESKSLVSTLPLPPTLHSPNTLSLSTVYGVVLSCLLTCIL